VANNKPFVVKSGLIPQTDNDQDLGGANNKFANAHISNLSGAVQINSAFTLPTADGSTGNVLQTDGAGNISWADLAAVTFSDTAPTSPQSGDLWFDSGTSAELFIWTGTEWISTTGGDQAAFTLKEFTGDNTTTVFSTGVGSNVSAFVYLNGVLLQETTDYSFANGDVTFVNPPFTNDVIQIVLHGNANFVNLSALGLDDTDNLSEGSTNLYYTDARVQTKLGNVSGDIIPDTNIAYDLGSTTNRFRDLYLSGNSIELGNRTLSEDNIPEVDLAIAPEVLEIQVSAPQAGQDTQWLWTWETSSLPYARREITNSPEIQVPLYLQGTYTVNNFAAYDLFDQMTQTHSLYLKWIDGAGTDNLISWAVSSGPVSDTHPDINGGNATDVQRINISVPSSITLPTLNAPSVSYTVTNNGTGAYTFSGAAKGDNPNLGPFYRGGTYTININAVGHPLYFTTDNGTNFSSGTYFGEYTDGVTGSRTDNGTITFTVPNDAPDTLYYQCGNHAPMRGAITVKDLAIETNINGNYIVYFQHTQEGHKTPVELRPIPSLVNQMCLVYDASVNKFVPQDLATYVENTPSFENKIREVAGTAELVVEDGSAVVAKVNIYDDSTYLPLTGNNAGDQAFATDNNILYIWDGSAWQQAGSTNADDLTEGATNLFYTDVRVDARIAAASVDDLSDVDTTSSAPTSGDALVWDGANWTPSAPFSQSDFDTAFGSKDTDDLAEGVSNLYYTDARADARISSALSGDVTVGGNLTVNGTTTTLNTATLDVEDINITIAKNATDNTTANGAGITVAGANATITYDGTNDEWDLNKDINVTGGVRANQPFFTNSQTVTVDHVIAVGDSAMAAGPVTIDSGVTVTISSGSRWVIV